MANRNNYLAKADPVHKAPALRTLFPSLKELRLDLEFVSDDTRPSSSHVHILHPAASASFRYPCPVGGCTGSFKLDVPIMRLLQGSQSRLTDEATCGGVRPQDRNTGKPCPSRLIYKAEATYGVERNVPARLSRV